MNTYTVMVRDSGVTTAIKELSRLIQGFGEITQERTGNLSGGTTLYRFVTIEVTNKTEYHRCKLMNDERLLLLYGKHEHTCLVLKNFVFEFNETDEAT